MTLKKTIAGLLMFTGIFHLIMGAMIAGQPTQAPLLLFGGLYSTLGVWAWRGGRTALLAAFVASALGLILGGTTYVENNGPLWLLAMLVIDVVILLCIGVWLFKARRA